MNQAHSSMKSIFFLLIHGRIANYMYIMSRSKVSEAPPSATPRRYEGWDNGPFVVKAFYSQGLGPYILWSQGLLLLGIRVLLLRVRASYSQRQGFLLFGVGVSYSQGQFFLLLGVRASYLQGLGHLSLKVQGLVILGVRACYSQGFGSLTHRDQNLLPQGFLLLEARTSYFQGLGSLILRGQGLLLLGVGVSYS